MKHSRHTMEARVAFIRRGGGATALRRLEKAGNLHKPTNREVERHIHPRHIKRSRRLLEML